MNDLHTKNIFRKRKRKSAVINLMKQIAVCRNKEASGKERCKGEREI